MIELVRLGKRFGARVAVESLSLTVEAGELLVLVGGSGSGKTTTLKMINRLVEPSAGQVRIDGQDHRRLPAWQLRRKIGYVFQEVGLFPHLSVAQNIAVTPELEGWSRPRIEERVDRLLETVDLDPAEFRHRRPAALSGGQRQRVGLARALAAEPRLMLLDEPFGALDPLTRDRLQVSFARIRRRLGLTAVFVTHDLTEALLLADRIAVLESGRLAQHGTPGELLRRPANEYVASLVEAPRRQAAELDAQLAAGGDSEAPS